MSIVGGPRGMQPVFALPIEPERTPTGADVRRTNLPTAPDSPSNSSCANVIRVTALSQNAVSFAVARLQSPDPSGLAS